MKYKVLEHPTNLKLKVYGQNLNELFKHALVAMFELMKPNYINHKVTRNVEIESTDQVMLLNDFLSELLYLRNTNHEAYFDADILEISNTKLIAKIYGRKISGLQTIIKDIIFNGLIINKVYEFYEAIILLEVEEKNNKQKIS